MVVHRCCAEDFVLPIGSFTKECGIFKLLAFTETDCGSAEVLINGIFGKRQCFQLLGKLLEGIVTFVGNFGLARFALTGSDKYHTIGGAATVDGSGRSVLQNLHRYDVRWVDGTEYTTVTVIVTRYGYTVDDVERFVAVQGVDATDTDGDTATRSTGVLRYLYTGGASLQSLVERGDYGFFQFVTRHADHGTGQVTAFHRTVTYNYYFVQHFVVLL